ncbi:cytochrome-c peroxidase [Candidatus Venteria ishoeyi]|uniref:Cytochrome c551 peroxidase n=1 Tax=Candidatus Venteria ishoeyi TaxID=1899563 RepID=A0A1H6FH41_9GAMM|nr:cytochrome-c peroxidase [Candidatus Venteria ishoeyi]SEH09362.1 Cytochrome c551 peroxidase precursor [Candidatus Venteria ishoeyi]
MMKKTILVTSLACAIGLGGQLSIAEAARNEPITPIPVQDKVDAPKVELGKKLFFDPRLSKSGFLSCNSCHNLSTGGADNLPSSIGHKWQLGPINSPTVLNARFNLAQFWDGRAKDLKEQAGGPIANPGEMASTHEIAVDVLSSIPAYIAEFKAVYGDKKVNMDRVTDAIASFEETLVTPDSPFDLWLKGDDAALSEEAKAGYDLFKNKGCIACHNGTGVGGTMYQKMGTVKPYTDTKTLGRYGVTGKDADKYFFKVPLLRNIELTAPYFHDASTWDLAEAVKMMGEYQLGLKLSDEETNKIVAFLKALTGKQPQISYPVLPPSTNKTPKPDRG